MQRFDPRSQSHGVRQNCFCGTEVLLCIAWVLSVHWVFVHFGYRERCYGLNRQQAGDSKNGVLSLTLPFKTSWLGDLRLKWNSFINNSVAPNVFLFPLAEVTSFVDATPLLRGPSLQDIHSYFCQAPTYNRMGRQAKALREEFPKDSSFFVFWAGKCRSSRVRSWGLKLPREGDADWSPWLWPLVSCEVSWDESDPFLELFQLQNGFSWHLSIRMVEMLQIAQCTCHHSLLSLSTWSLWSPLQLGRCYSLL